MIKLQSLTLDGSLECKPHRADHLLLLSAWFRETHFSTKRLLKWEIVIHQCGLLDKVETALQLFLLVLIKTLMYQWLMEWRQSLRLEW
uniref:Uncharacterized protein n=1 Tax=Brassica campestris TaxID=3711 RepID=A0A3P5ZQR6_BRACM|nr:unnamed protein product [Brassica rapa]